MSWGVSKAAKGSEIVAAFDDGAKGYGDPKTQRILASIRDLVIEMTESHDDHIVTVETSGHVDLHSGMGTVTIRVWSK